MTRQLDGYDVGTAIERLWHFTWYEFCDWYLEATKLEDAAATRAPVATFVLNNVMRLLHPFAPFITEEVWLSLPHDGDTIMTATWPDPLEVPRDRDAAQRMERLMEVVTAVRNRRAELRVAPGESLSITLRERAFTPSEASAVERLAGAKASVGPLPAGVLFTASLDAAQVENERRRLAKESMRLRAEVERGEKKLANAQFVANARADVVEKEREKLERYRSELARVQQALEGHVFVNVAEPRKVLIGGREIERTIARLAQQILEPEESQAGVVLLGVRRGGEALATRLAAEMARTGGRSPLLGFLNINLYRDDRVVHELPESQIPADVTGRVVVIVDDVLFTGRTIRAALDAVTDLGRPAAIRLCVLVDRGLRELPIQPDYVGRTISSRPAERVRVSLGVEPSVDDEVAVADAT